MRLDPLAAITATSGALTHNPFSLYPHSFSPLHLWKPNALFGDSGCLLSPPGEAQWHNWPYINSYHPASPLRNLILCQGTREGVDLWVAYLTVCLYAGIRCIVLPMYTSDRRLKTWCEHCLTCKYSFFFLFVFFALLLGGTSELSFVITLYIWHTYFLWHLYILFYLSR